MASGSKSGALKISSPRELENWLKSLQPDQGRWVAVAIAARAALRVAPLVATDAERKRSFLNLAFVTFFAMASARAAAKYPAHASRLDVRRAAHAPADASLATSAPSADAAARSASQAAGAAAEAARATALTTFYGHASAAADASANAARTAAIGATYTAAEEAWSVGFAAVADVWSAVSRDANFIVSGGTAQALSSERLWPDGEPRWIAEQMHSLREALPPDDDWFVWTDWYQDRVEGLSDPEEIELVFATVPDKQREAGPAAANRWIKERLEELARKKPIVPPKLPAAIEPIIADGKIALPANPTGADLDSETLDAALIALRMQIADLADDLDVEANIDKRVIGFLRRLAERIPQASPTQAQLFMLAHEQETLENYGKTVATEWPALLAGRYLATTLAFDRTARQFPKWRLFKQNADRNRLTDHQRADLSKLAADLAAALREEEAAEYIASEIPDTFEEMCRRLDAARDEAREDRIAAGADTLAEDTVASIENIIKLIAETALAGGARAAKVVRETGVAYADGIEEGIKDQAKKEGKKDGAALVKWTKRTIMGVAGVAATGISAKAAGLGPVIVRVIEGYPQIAEWSRPVVHFFSQ